MAHTPIVDFKRMNKIQFMVLIGIEINVDGENDMRGRSMTKILYDSPEETISSRLD